MTLNPFNLYSPETLKKTVDIYFSKEDIKIMAGGTFLINQLKLLRQKGIRTPEHIISLRKIAELKGVNTKDDELIIKSMTSLSDLCKSDIINKSVKGLREACLDMGTNPIRNMASVGGNLTCRYSWTELPAIMVALDASYHFVSKDAKNNTVKAEDFYKESARTDNILTHVSVKNKSSRLMKYKCIRKRSKVDIPLVAVCITADLVNNRLSNVRVSVNNCITFAQRDLILEEYLNSVKLDTKSIDEATNNLDHNIYNVGNDDYKKYIAPVIIKDCLNEFFEYIK